MKTFKKIFGMGIILSILLVPILFLEAEDNLASSTRRNSDREVRISPLLKASATIMRLEERASTTLNRLENRQNIIDRIRAKLASTTASTSPKRIESLNNRLEKQMEKISEVKDRLLNREIKVTEVLGKISDKISERIDILGEKGFNVTAAKTKLAEAVAKIAEITAKADTLSTLIETEITEANQAQLFADIKTIQVTIRSLVKEAKGLLIDTIKEITKILPAKPEKSATSTATTTE